MKSTFLTILLLPTINISKAQNNTTTSDTPLYKIEILKGTIEELQIENNRLKLKFPSIKTDTHFKAPYFYLTTICDQKEQTDLLIKELIHDYPALKLNECEK